MKTTLDQLKVIRVNAIEFNAIFGHEYSFLSYCGSISFEVGDSVVIRQYSVTEDVFSGLEIQRYVIEVTDRYSLYSDDYSCRLKLSPFRRHSF